LEIAIANGLIKESGGVMVTLDRENLGEERFLNFGQENHIPVISASTIELAEQLITFLEKN
jgi:hypothetical protein